MLFLFLESPGAPIACAIQKSVALSGQKCSQLGISVNICVWCNFKDEKHAFLNVRLEKWDFTAPHCDLLCGMSLESGQKKLSDVRYFQLLPSSLPS